MGLLIGIPRKSTKHQILKCSCPGVHTPLVVPAAPRQHGTRGAPWVPTSGYIALSVFPPLSSGLQWLAIWSVIS